MSDPKKHRRFLNKKWIKKLSIIIIFLSTSVTTIYLTREGFTHGMTEFSGRGFAQKKYASVFKCELKECAQDSSDMKPNKFQTSKNQNEIVKKNFDTRLANYKEDYKELSSYIKSLGIFVVFGFLLLYYDPKEITLPFLGTAIPQSLVALVIVSGLIYYWINFGLLIMSTVDARMVLEYAVDYREDMLETSINHYYSQSRILLDHGFVDAWCNFHYNVFKTGFKVEKHYGQGMFYLFLIYAPLFGAVIGVSFTVSLDLFVKQANILTATMISIILFMLPVSSIQMASWFPHSSLFYAGIWCYTSLFLVTWILKRGYGLVR